MVELTPAGLYCKAGDFYIDPWRPVHEAVITHGHADHARQGAERYHCTQSSAPILLHRLSADLNLRSHQFGKKFQLKGATVSFHPAGHVLGSAQVRIETADGVWVVSGDYKRTPDASCEPFEVVPCDVFISESTFGLPVYAWPTSEKLAQQIF